MPDARRTPCRPTDSDNPLSSRRENGLRFCPVLTKAQHILCCAFATLFGLSACAQSPIRQSFGEFLAGGKLGSAVSGGEKCDVLVEWMSRLEREFPDIRKERANVAYLGSSPHNRTNKELELEIRKLYQDEWFTPVFGSAYDVRWPDKHEIAKKNWLPTCSDQSKYQRATQFLQYRNVTGALIFPSPETAAAIAKARRLKQDMPRALAEIRALPRSTDGYWKAHNAVAQWEEEIAYLWPSEGLPFLENLREGLRPLASIALADKITASIAAATDSDGIVRLSQIRKEYSDMFEEAPSDVAVQEKTRLKQGLNDAFSKQLTGELRKLDARGTGLAAVKTETDWYADIKARYINKFEETPAMSDALRRFGLIRRQDLADNAGQLMTLVRQAETPAQLDGLQKEYLLPLDSEFPAGKEIVALIDARRPIVKFETEDKWKFSAREIAMMKAPGVLEVQDEYGPPNTEEIRLALLRAFDRKGAEGSEWVNAHVVKWRLPSPAEILAASGQNPFLPFPNLAIRFATVRFANVEDAKCTKLPGVGYRCRYHVSYQVDTMGTTFRSWEGLFVEDTFVLERYGWESPTSREAIFEAGVMVVGKFAELGQEGARRACRALAGAVRSISMLIACR